MSQEDSWSWKNNIFTVKDAYLELINPAIRANIELFKAIWSTPIASNIVALVWKMSLNKLPTKDKLIRKRIQLSNNDNNYMFFHQVKESILHLFFSSKFSSWVWNSCFKWPEVLSAMQDQVEANFGQHGGWVIGKKQKRVWWVIWFVMLWFVWNHQNDILFNNVDFDLEKIVDSIRLKRDHGSNEKLEWNYFNFLSRIGLTSLILYWKLKLCLDIGCFVYVGRSIMLVVLHSIDSVNLYIVILVKCLLGHADLGLCIR